jgi:hypothetical protein
VSRLGLPQNLFFIIVQLAGPGVAGTGAKGFIHGVNPAAPSSAFLRCCCR